MHTDDCGAQCKRRQNFARLVSSSSSTTTHVHEFTQKHGFKGPWNGTSKLIKNSIKKLEMRLTRVASAMECYQLITLELTKDDATSSKWHHYVDTRNQLITEKLH